jgi:hypothetical protein
MSKLYPTLMEFISSASFQDGSSREGGSITWFLQDGLLKACLRDKTLGAVAFVSGSSLTALLKAMEQGLVSGKMEWRADKAAKGKASR